MKKNRIIIITLLSLCMYTGFIISNVQFAYAQLGGTQAGQTGGTQSGQTGGTQSGQIGGTQAGQPGGIYTVPNPLKGPTTLLGVLAVVLDVVVQVGAVIAVLFIIWSGFLFITAQGNPEKIRIAKSTLYTTLVGTALVLGSSVIASILVNTVNKVTNK